MLGFSPKFKFSELGKKINEGYFDDDIRKYLQELITDGEEIKEPSNYFDVTVEYDNGDGNCYLYSGSMKFEMDRLTKKEKELLDLFVARIDAIYQELTELKENEDVCYGLNGKCTGRMIRQDYKEDGKTVWICNKCGAKELIDN